MSEGLKQKIRAARPSLRLVSPVSFWFVLLMGVFNLIIGLGFIFALEDAAEMPAFSVIAQVIPYWLWGILFMALGIAKLWSLKINSWKWARYTLLAGVGLKTGWAVALTTRAIADPDNMFLAVTWITIALTQVLTYIHFLPPSEMRLFNGKKTDS